ncbi:hypothetical protein [Streptomyces sp. NPDC051162]|uniref:hypothetical protein n=1 Tax=Streptomyces sp. NPDC051162 TaxID=3154747 RepID=UPI00342E0D81
MIVYRLSSPIDFFTDYTPLPDWLRDGAPEKTAWLLEATLALNDAAAVVRWGGDMRHLPSVSAPDGGLALIVKQDNNGDTFVISRNPVAWAEDECDLRHETPTRRIGRLTHPTDDEIAEAMGYGIDAPADPPPGTWAEPGF